MSGKPKLTYVGRLDRHTDEIWLIWSNKWGCWYRANSQGYTDKVEAAGLFDRATAAAHFKPLLPRKHRDTEPFPLSSVKRMLIERADQLTERSNEFARAAQRLENLAARATRPSPAPTAGEEERG